VGSSEPSGLLLTLDVGGSHVSAALCSLDDLRVIETSDAPLAGVSSFEGFLELIYLLGREVSGGGRLAGASLAVPGPFDCAAGVSLIQHKLLWMYKKDLRGALAARFGWAADQIRFLNDANAFLLGELHAGSARDACRAVGMTLGTGIGSAFALEGHYLTEGKGVPPGGEIWNCPYRGGTVEDLISSRALSADYASRTGKNLTVKKIAELAPDDPAARQVFAKLGRDLGNVIRDVIVPFEPEVVVVGGAIARSAPLFLPVTQSAVDDLGVRILPSLLFDRAQLIGAAAYWRDEHPGDGDARLEGQEAHRIESR
jgi:glucokinase